MSSATARNAALVGLGSVGAVAVGTLASVSPLLSIAFVVGVGFVVAVLSSLTLGLVLFTLMIFFSQLGQGASVTKLAGLLLTLAWLLALLRHESAVPFMPRERAGVFYTALAFVAWATFSLLWASDASAVTSTATRLILNFILFLIVFSTVVGIRQLRAVMLAYVAGGALTSLYGIASGSTQADSAAVGRLAGGIGDPNELAALILPGLVFAAFLLATERHLLMRIALASAAAIFLVTIFLTQSRGGLIALGVALVAGIVFGGPLRGKLLATGLVVAACTVVVFALVVPVSSLGRITSFSGGGGTGRLDLWTVALHVAADHPLAGVGAGNFTVVEPRYAASVANLPRVDLVLDAQKVAHNTYLNILADLGAVGLIAFLLVVAMVLRAAVATIRRVEAEGQRVLGLYGRAIVIGIVGMLSAFVFISAQYEKQLWLVLGLAAAFASLREAGPRRVRAVAPHAADGPAPAISVARV